MPRKSISIKKGGLNQTKILLIVGVAVLVVTGIVLGLFFGGVFDKKDTKVEDGASYIPRTYASEGLTNKAIADQNDSVDQGTIDNPTEYFLKASTTGTDHKICGRTISITTQAAPYWKDCIKDIVGEGGDGTAYKEYKAELAALHYPTSESEEDKAKWADRVYAIHDGLDTKFSDALNTCSDIVSDLDYLVGEVYRKALLYKVATFKQFEDERKPGDADADAMNPFYIALFTVFKKTLTALSYKDASPDNKKNVMKLFFIYKGFEQILNPTKTQFIAEDPVTKKMLFFFYTEGKESTLCNGNNFKISKPKDAVLKNDFIVDLPEFIHYISTIPL